MDGGPGPRRGGVQMTAGMCALILAAIAGAAIIGFGLLGISARLDDAEEERYGDQARRS